MNRQFITSFLGLAVVSLAILLVAGIVPVPAALESIITGESNKATNESTQPARQPVTVVAARRAAFTESILLTGSLVAREEILVMPEISGLRIVTLGADEGDKVKKGQVLAQLVTAQLQTQLAQNAAALARTNAAINQASSLIIEARANLEEAQNAHKRATILRRKGHIANSAFDIKKAALRRARARLASATDGQVLARADKAQVIAQGQELDWKMSNTKIVAPRGGIISQRSARVGAMASGSAAPLFRIIARGEIEFEAEVPEADLAKLKIGQQAVISLTGVGKLKGSVRLIYPEIDKATRLGKIRVFLGVNPALHIGAFARGEVDTAASKGLAVPLSALVFDRRGAHLQIIDAGRVVTRNVDTGLSSGGRIEITSGIAAGDLVVVRAGTFLRDGDAVKPVLASAQIISEAF